MNKRSLLATPYIVWIIGFTVLPILMIVFYALGDGNGGFTLSNILAIFEPVHLKSLLLALWLALLCTVITREIQRLILNNIRLYKGTHFVINI